MRNKNNNNNGYIQYKNIHTHMHGMKNVFSKRKHDDMGEKKVYEEKKAQATSV
jgi:hypothetical protein